MPTYDYKCHKCYLVTSCAHSMTDKPTYVCPKCNFAPMVKMISGGIGIHFKGSGFYETDYKNK